VGSRFNVNPILLGVTRCKSFRDGPEPCVPVRIRREHRNEDRNRGLGSVAALTRIPLINNHLDRHLASLNAARALFLVGSCCKSPMTAFPVSHLSTGFGNPRRYFAKEARPGSRAFQEPANYCCNLKCSGELLRKSS
jgi:hypothetical protein